MKVAKYIIVMLLLLLTINSVLAEEFSSEIELIIDGIENEVTIKYEGESKVYNINESQYRSYIINYNINRTSSVSCPPINYSRIAHVNHEDIVQEFANQQSYIRETFLPSVQEMESIKAENELLDQKLDFCNDATEDLGRALSFINQSKGEYVLSLEKQNSSYSTLIAGIMVILILIIGVALTKNKRGGRL